MQPPQIDYAPATPGQKRRRAAQRVGVGVVVLVLAMLALKAAPRVWHRVQLLYWQHQAMSYTAPADRVVYDDDPAHATKLLSANPALKTGSHGEVFEFVPAWEQFYRLLSPPGRQASATLFLHERRNASGERRLVVVEESQTYYFGSTSGLTPVQDMLKCQVLKPGTAYNDPQELETTGIFSGPVHFGPPSKVRWFAGQLDVANQSHFTIRGTIDDNPIKVDGWLRDDWVKLSASP